MTFQGKRIVVLGGSSGIGLAVAQAAAAQGASLVIVTVAQGTPSWRQAMATKSRILCASSSAIRWKFFTISASIGTPSTKRSTGGDALEAEREQWNDANNVLTIRPGVVIGYERNVWTNEKYDKAGITVLPIPGDELGRGRGGARCMSCPLERDGI